MLKAFGRTIPTTLDELLTEPSALIVWDMQEGIARRATNIDLLLATIPSLTRAAHRSGRPVIYSQHYSIPLEFEDRAWLRTSWEASGRPDTAAQIQSPYLPGSAAWQFLPETAPASGDLVIPKTRPNFFVGTPLRSHLATLGVDTVVLTGVATERGILATARDASLRGVMTIVALDAVGSFSDSAQERGLEELSRISHTCSSDQIIAAWRV